MDISWRHFLPHSGLPVISTINCLTLDVIRWETNALKSFNGRRQKKKNIYLALNCLRCLLSHIHHQLLFFYGTRALCGIAVFRLKKIYRIIVFCCVQWAVLLMDIYVRFFFWNRKTPTNILPVVSVSGVFIERLSFLMSVTCTRVDLTSRYFRPNYL